jgi:predicted GNAT family acetyltransferase
MRDIDLATYREDPEMPAGSVAAVAGANAAYRALPGTRSFIASHGGEDAAKATLYSDGHTAQIEDVATLVRHRGRGLAGAVVAHAACEALAGGHETVFLMCDLDGGPVALYERIGFRPAGHTWTFTRPG